MKRLMSFFLSLSLICSLFVFQIPASAESESDVVAESNFETSIKDIARTDSESASLVAQARVDLSNLESVGFEPATIKPQSVNSNGKIVYEVALSDDVTDKITTSEDTQGNLTLNFYEGNKHNVLVFLANGDLLVDGHKIPSSSGNTTKAENESSSQSEPLAHANSRNDEFSTSPWGSPSSYNNVTGDISANTCDWGVATIASLAVGVVATIIAYYTASKLSAQIAISCFATVAAAMISYTEIHGMDDAYFSYYFAIYHRNDYTTYDGYSCYCGDCYSQKNHGGTPFDCKFYRHSWFS